MPTLQREWVSAHRGRVGLRAAARRGCRGVAAVEFAVVVPVLLLLMLGIVYYGVIFAMQQALTLAAEEGARAALRYQSTNAQRVAAAYTAVFPCCRPFSTGGSRQTRAARPWSLARTWPGCNA